MGGISGSLVLRKRIKKNSLKEESPKVNLLTRWKNREKKETSNSGIPKAPKGVSIPLSNGQQRLWFLQQLYSENGFYNYAESYTLTGILNEDYLLRSLQFVFDSNAILRTTYHSTNGETTQKVNEGELNVSVRDISDLEASAKEKEKNDIILASGATYFDLTLFPLVRISLIKLEEELHVLSITMHHIITDKWSMGLFREQMANYYSTLLQGEIIPLNTEALQYTDYALWQSKEAIDKEQLSYWRKKLVGEIPTLNLRTDFVRKAEPTQQGAFNTTQLSDTLSKGILELAKDMGTTPYVFMLSVYYILLYKYTGQHDILIGSPISNRKNKQLEALIGFFNNTVVLRSKINATTAFTDFVQEIRTMTLEAFSNNEIEFDALVKELNPDRSLGGNPFFQVMFLYHSVLPTPSFGGNLNLSHSTLDLGVAKFDLTLYISEDNGQLSPTFEYATDLFEETTINQFQEHYELLLTQIVENPKQAISKIDMLTRREKELFIQEKSQLPKPYENYTGIHKIIEEAAAENKDGIAVIYGENKITYGELIKEANKCASEIISITKGENRIIGLCVECSVEMAIGILGILKAGCAYLPLDPEYPLERIEFMLKDAEVETVLTQKTLDLIFNNFEGTQLHFEDISGGEAVEEISLDISEASLAYVIYTSGSTGKPKGVPIRHRNIIRSTESRLDFYSDTPSAFLLLSSIAFDSSKAGVFWTLCTGGTLVIGEKHIEQDMHNLGSLIEKNGITHTLMLPSLYNLCLENCSTQNLMSLQTVIVAGEACSSNLVTSHFKTLPKVKLYNEYGPTEGTVWCIAHQITQNDIETVPIGKTVNHSEIYLLNADHSFVPYGSIGEIFIGGSGLAGKYLNRPELTDEAYIDNPFETKGREKLYKTGDLGRYNTDGNIEFLGRTDQQVKIRGHRIEIDEVEKGILELEAVSEAIVVVQELHNVKQLFAYVILDDGVDVETIKGNLRSKFPKHMVPSKIIELDNFPHLPNGKIDKNKLAELGRGTQVTGQISADRAKTKTQEKLVAIWQDVLQINAVGIHDNFFELGGDSILSIRIIATARKMGMSFTPKQLFENQTIAELDIFVSESEEKENQKKEVVFGETLLTPVQQWFFETHQLAPNFWNQGIKIAGLPNLNLKSAQKAANTIFKQHDALRSVFKKTEGEWSATILKPEDGLDVFVTIDITQLEVNQVKDRIAQELEIIQISLDLSKGPLFRCVYFSTNANSDDIAILLAHHLVIDVISWKIVTDDFISHLEDAEKSHDFKSSSIKDWGSYLQGIKSTVNNELDFWKEQLPVASEVVTDFERKFPIAENAIEVITSTIEISLTESLMGDANETFGTKVDELILTALVATIGSWTNKDAVTIAMERHGRETMGTSLDLSSTVGWFTSFFPIKFETGVAQSLDSKIIGVKEQMRKIPNGGVGYGILRYLDNKLGDVDYPQIVFNFLGKQGVTDTRVEFMTEGVRHPLSERSYLLEINAEIRDGLLIMRWSYSPQHHKAATIEKLLSDFNTIVAAIVERCTSGEDGKFTPSDFPEAGLSQDDLDNLMSQF